MDQEEIAYIFAEYDLLVLPVVDDAGRLVSVVTVDDIFDVIEEETTEDMYEMVAIPSEERTDRPAVGVVRLRLPWLAGGSAMCFWGLRGIGDGGGGGAGGGDGCCGAVGFPPHWGRSGRGFGAADYDAQRRVVAAAVFWDCGVFLVGME